MQRFMLDGQRAIHGCGKGLGIAGIFILSGCAGLQSTLAPASPQAEQIAQLWWWMLGGALIVWAIMLLLSFYAIFARRGRHYRRITAWVVIGGGVFFPTVLLTILLCFGLSLLPALVAHAPPGSLVIDVEGIQWWWRVSYPEQQINGQAYPGFETANEIYLPIDRPVEFRLHAADVIHSFWIPALGGKVDMIPGRETHLAVHPNRTGYFRGACAEYCGASHALMNFDVHVVSQNDYEKWLIHQVSAPTPQLDASAERGQKVFLSQGCGACHTLRGTSARGSVGPDLTRFGNRSSLGAGLFANETQSLLQWLKETEQVKPGVHMPNFKALGESQLMDLVRFLEQLQ